MAYMPQKTMLGVGAVGEYDELAQPWSWLFYPPPYDFTDPQQITPPPTFIAPAASMGMGDCGCGGSCGGCSGGHAHGMGLFDSGWDISGWGWQEWGLVAVGLYVVSSVFMTTKSAASSVGRSVRKRRSRSARRAALQAQLAGL